MPWARLHFENGFDIRTGDLHRRDTSVNALTEQGAPNTLGDILRDRSGAGHSHGRYSVCA